MFLIEARGLGTDRQDNTTRSTARQKRKFRRFKLRYPVHVKFRSGELASELDTVSGNVSVGGLLLRGSLADPSRQLRELRHNSAR
jgi:hypothetical protein